jgi:hypothetical protein
VDAEAREIGERGGGIHDLATEGTKSAERNGHEKHEKHKKGLGFIFVIFAFFVANGSDAAAQAFRHPKNV